MSIGVVIVTHYRLGEEFLQALRLIVPDAPEFIAVAVDPGQSVDRMRGAIAVSLSFLEDHAVEVVTGLNLPMLIKLATMTEEKSLEDLASFIKSYGRRNISVASEILPDEDR
jgi:PTS system mannose-specific IIA component